MFMVAPEVKTALLNLVRTRLYDFNAVAWRLFSYLRKHFNN